MCVLAFCLEPPRPASGADCYAVGTSNILNCKLHVLLYILFHMLNNEKIKKIWVFDHKAAFMQRLADYVRTGHQAYIQGTTETAKIFPTWEKLVQNNPVFNDRLKAFRAREKGEPTGRLLLYQNQKHPEKIHWFLLIHGTTDQLPAGEKWQHAEDPHHRIQFTGYELVRVTKEGASKPVWTWKYSQEKFQELRDYMVMAIRSRRDQDLKVLAESLFGTMGFSGSREQAKSLTKLAKDEWKRRRPGETMPDMPLGFGWIRRKADKGIWLIRPAMGRPHPKERPVDPNRPFLGPQNIYEKGGDWEAAMIFKTEELMKERQTDE